ncbi:MauE/DoxX family redox-associated membrane protein [Micromonospora sp. DT229]|uniref:MauE/DoxX family redox-associated membrane protein n=1 Tax=Micromonospora sp. DT229 TaxID=3393430 RepID=UPI003CF096C0
MSGFSTLVTVLALGGALLLLVAGVGHAVHPQRVRALLARQALLPSAMQAWAGRLLGAIEVGLALVVVGVVLLAPHLSAAGYALLAGAYLVLAGYAEVLRRRRPGTPCGCLAGGRSTGLPVVIRALIFAAAAAAAGSFGLAAAATQADTVPGLEVWLAAGVMATAGWLVPELFIGTVADRSGLPGS